MTVFCLKFRKENGYTWADLTGSGRWLPKF